MTAASHTARRLSELASMHGVQLSYTAQGGRRVKASADTLLAVLSALGHPVSNARSIDAELALAKTERQKRVLEPVTVLGRDGALMSPVTVDSQVDRSGWWLSATDEEGGVVRRRLDEVSTTPGSTVAGEGLRDLGLDLGGLGLGPGYHRLEIEGSVEVHRSLLLVPPPQAPALRGFGVFSPLYALRGAADRGVGTYRDLATFADLVGEWGGSLAGTLPLFAAFFRDPVDPSPYLPVSRRFLNELYVDVLALPELATCDEARALVDSADYRTSLDALRRSEVVDYAAVMARQRLVLESCAKSIASQPSRRRDDLESFAKTHPDLDRYAEFRAADERLVQPWRAWPSAPGELPAIELSAASVRYHRYVQFVAAEQLAAAADAGGGHRAGLYLDLPVGVHPDGYDTWASSDVFSAAGVGAPPDSFFSGGQSWGFPPLHPEGIRRDGYRYLIDSYRSVLAYARAIRIDHVLGLQRLFWIPDGCGPDAGAYVRYRSEEVRAIIAIEAARTGATVVGEDLGTVPPGIRSAMDADGMLHSFVYQFTATATDPLPQPRNPAMASLGGHDLPRFASFWRGTDIGYRQDEGLIDAETAAIERRKRRELVAAVARAGPASSRVHPASGELTDDAVRAALVTCLDALAAGPATYLMTDLADLELDTAQDNHPGTGPEAPNWRHRLARPLTEIAADDDIRAVMEHISARRAAANAEGERA